MESAVEPAQRVGQVIAGKYALLRVLGSGGMGAVYEAEHAFTRRRVAVKLMHASFARSGVAADRFIREAQAPCQIGHPGIVDVLDAGRDEDGTLYLVLEMLRGSTLAEAMETGALTAQAVTELAVELLDALNAAHGAGFIHRDIKPENVFLAEDGAGGFRVKLLDFGVAGMVANTDQQLTMTGAVLGTPLYMSPEQAKGQRVNAATDLWAVGALLYTALAGAPPFQADTYNALIVSIATREHVPLSHLRPELPRSLLRVIERALRKDLSQRWRSADAMRRALLESLDEADPALDSFPPMRPAEPSPAATAAARPERRRAAKAFEPTPRSSPGDRGDDDDRDLTSTPPARSQANTGAHSHAGVPPVALSRLTGDGIAPDQSPSGMPWVLGAAATVALALGSLWLVKAQRAPQAPPPAALVDALEAHPQAPKAQAKAPKAQAKAPKAQAKAAPPAAPEPVLPSDLAPTPADAPAPTVAIDPEPARANQGESTPAPEPPPARGIGTDVLARIVADHQPALERCYQDALATAMLDQPGQAARPLRIDVTMTVAASGRVRDITLRGASSRALETCLKKALVGMPFPTAAAATEVAFPIVFQPRVLGT